MRYRNRLAKPSGLLWLLVAVADVLALNRMVGVRAMLTVLGAVLTVAVGALGVWLLRGSAGTVIRSTPVRGPVRPVQRPR